MALPVGTVLGGLSAIMLITAVLAGLLELTGHIVEAERTGTYALLGAATITGLVAGVAWRVGKSQPARRSLTRRDAALAVTLIWFGTGVFGAVPFLLGAPLSPTDAFFESVSGITTTGGTILVDIEATMSRPLLLWRSVLQWVGAMGIVVLFVAVFPNLGVSGRHMFRNEVPGPTQEGLQPRITETAFALWAIYAIFTAVMVVVFLALGALTAKPDAPVMDLFQSICHALTTTATGGFSPMNDSIGAFQSRPIELAAATAMLLSGVNYALYYSVWVRGTLKGFLRSTELKAYVLIVVTSVLLLTMGLLDRFESDPLTALHVGYFTTATFITSTGYGIDTYMAYPSWSVLIILLLMFVGGMTGSTAGGIKVSRIVLLLRSVSVQVRRSVRPSVVEVVRMGRQSVPQAVLTEVATFFFAYVAFLTLGTLTLSLLDATELPRAFGAMVSALSNMGPSPFHGGDDNFASWTDASKTLLAAAMILGRLEFFTVLALLLPDFWRR